MSSAKRARAFSALRPLLEVGVGKDQGAEAGLLLGDVVVQALGQEGLLGREELQGPGPDEGPFLVLYVARLEAEAVLVVHQDPPWGRVVTPVSRLTRWGPAGSTLKAAKGAARARERKRARGRSLMACNIPQLSDKGLIPLFPVSFGLPCLVTSPETFCRGPHAGLGQHGVVFRPALPLQSLVYWARARAGLGPGPKPHLPP